MSSTVKITINNMENCMNVNSVNSDVLYESNSQKFKYLTAMIDKFVELVNLGFTHENWNNAVNIIRSIEPYADLQILKALGAILTVAYAQPSYDMIEHQKNEILNMIKNRTFVKSKNSRKKKV